MTNNSKYDKLCFLSIFAGNPFAGIKKFNLLIDNETITIKENGPYENKLYVEPIVSTEEVNELKSNISKINFDNWESTYPPNEKVLDPYNWTVVLKFENDRYDKMEFNGVNNYPEDWNNLIDIISKYTNIFNEDTE